MQGNVSKVVDDGFNLFYLLQKLAEMTLSHL